MSLSIFNNNQPIDLTRQADCVVESANAWFVLSLLHWKLMCFGVNFQQQTDRNTCCGERRRSINSCLNTKHICFGPELIKSQQRWLLHRCCAQFRCWCNSLLHWVCVVFGQELRERRNWSFQQLKNDRTSFRAAYSEPTTDDKLNAQMRIICNSESYGELQVCWTRHSTHPHRIVIQDFIVLVLRWVIIILPCSC
jgi:hypothetical protein